MACRRPSLGLLLCIGGSVVGALALATPGVAFAQDTSQLPPVPSMDEQEREGTPRPAAPDDRSGHVYIRAS